MLKKIDSYNASGTGLEGYVTITYAKLVEVLGDPNDDGDGYKVDAAWVLSDEAGNIITI